jgi:hypothetical protein
MLKGVIPDSGQLPVHIPHCIHIDTLLWLWLSMISTPHTKDLIVQVVNRLSVRSSPLCQTHQKRFLRPGRQKEKIGYVNTTEWILNQVLAASRQ